MKTMLKHFIITLIFIGGSGILCLQTLRPIFPEPRPLYGVTSEVVTPAFSWNKFLQGNYQQAVERWFSQKIGFRPFWVRTYNQINMSVFRQVAKAKGTKIVLGKRNWLYEQDYLDAYAFPAILPTNAVAKSAERLLKLQRELAAHGILLLVLISPSKAAVYPEYLPEKYRQASSETTYSKVLASLQQAGIHTLDAYCLFMDAKTNSPYPLFPKSGVHWNDYGALLTIQELIKIINKETGRQLPIPSAENVEMAAPREPENDLSQLLNIWTPGAFEEPCPYPQIIPQPMPTEQQPRILLVGDSFAWKIADFLSTQQLCANIEFLYYAKRHIAYPAKTQREFVAEKADWQSILLEKDVIILELNQAYLHNQIGFGFVNSALHHLD